MSKNIDGVICQVQKKGDRVGGNVVERTDLKKGFGDTTHKQAPQISINTTNECYFDSKAFNGLRSGSTSRSSLSRDKPRVPKIFQSLCCCIRSTNDESLKRRSSQPHTPILSNNPSSLITQVRKDELSSKVDSGPETSLSSELVVYPTEEISELDAMVPECSDKLLLPLLPPSNTDKKCLIIDLDETLVHSSFKPVENADFIIPVEIDNVMHQVYVLKRPYVDEFLERIGDKFECVLFTASLAKYADPVADLLDKHGVFRTRLFRESCVFHKGNYVKDLTRLGRDLRKIIIVDNSPASYAFHPDNAIAVPSWFDDMNDSELLSIIPLLEQLADVDSIYSVLRNSNGDLRRCSLLESSNDMSR